jgi:glycerol kinase
MLNKIRAEGLESIVQEKTGLVIDAYFSDPKVAWLLQNDHGAREKPECGELAFGTRGPWNYSKAVRKIYRALK